MNRFSSVLIVAALALAACGPTDPPLSKSDNNETTPMDMGGMETTPPDMSAPEGCEETEADETTCDGEDNDCDGVTDEGCACDFEQKTNGVCPGGAIDASSGMCAAPSAYEADETSCDGEDNDCDGVVDEGCSCEFNGSSQGVCASGSVAADGSCAAPANFESNETSCDGEDNDCDGIVDGGCECNFNDSSDGVCQGSSIDPNTGACSTPAAYEADETTCDGNDNDCDGVVDEGCTCDYNDTTRGVCQGSTRSATDGSCQEPADFEADETSCDGKDNDCDGSTDEGCGCPFMGSMQGVCGAGLVNPNTNACDAPNNFEMDESTCDGSDNDCDGVVDEGCTCNFEQKVAGVCRQGTINAADGMCISPPSYEANEQACDQLDNDCDGVTDENCACNFSNRNTGVCTGGVIDATSGVCTAPADYQATETSCDGKDNNCDGVIDEGCGCQFDNDSDGVCGLAIIDDMGVCAQPANYEADESTCDMEDNDCDGEIDEGCPRAPTAGELIVTEFMPDPVTVTDENGEWFEIQNVSQDPIELKGLVFADNTVTGRLTVATSHILMPGERFVFGRSADQAVNGGVAVDYAQQEFILNNNGDAIQILRNMNGSLVTIDQVVYTGAWPYSGGRAASLSSDSLTATDNDDMGNWCEASQQIGATSNYGTPGDANPSCSP
jgi:hypothetical protein